MIKTGQVNRSDHTGFDWKISYYYYYCYYYYYIIIIIIFQFSSKEFDKTRLD